MACARLAKHTSVILAARECHCPRSSEGGFHGYTPYACYTQMDMPLDVLDAATVRVIWCPSDERDSNPRTGDALPDWSCSYRDREYFQPHLFVPVEGVENVWTKKWEFKCVFILVVCGHLRIEPKYSVLNWFDLFQFSGRPNKKTENRNMRTELWQPRWPTEQTRTKLNQYLF